MNKYTTALSIAVLGAAATIGAKVIENPDFKMSSSLTFGITRVELSDTATRVSVDIYGRPGEWVSAADNFLLRGHGTGKEYPLRSVEGIQMNQKVYLTDSAYVSATFIFPPLAPADTIVDFQELESSITPWSVSGLNLGIQPRGNIRTDITGSVKGRPEASWLILIPAGDDIRMDKFRIVPVRDGKFRYTLATDEPEVYMLCTGPEVMRGAMTMYRFFTEGADVNIDILADNNPDAKKRIAGGPLTQGLNDFLESQNRHFAEARINDRVDSLEAAHALYTPEAYALRDILESGEDIPEQRLDSLYQQLERLQERGGFFTAAGLEATAEAGKRAEVVAKEVEAIESDFIRDDKSPVGLFLIYSKMRYNDPNFRKLLPFFADVYQKRFPDHKYTKVLAKFLGQEAAEPGYRVPDFSAPDLDGNVHNLSELIQGKTAVVDLWASWCAPCREHSKALVPVYEKWKDRGFTVVGIARENGNTDAMKKAIAKDGYPWLNLVELNDAGRIWERYGAGLSGGRMVLVDPNGTVIAVDPTAEEVDAYLEQLGNQ